MIHNQRVSERQDVIIKANSNNIENGQAFPDASMQIIKEDGDLTNKSKELWEELRQDTMPLKSVEAKNEDLASFIRRDSKNVPDLIVDDSVSLRTVVNRSNDLVMDRSSQLTAINTDFKRSSSRKIDIIKLIQTLDDEIQKLEQKLTAAKTREEEEEERKANLKKGLSINISDFETQQKGFGKRVVDVGNSVNNYSGSRESGNKELITKRSQLEERRKVLAAKPDMNGDLEVQLKSVQARKAEIQSLNTRISNFNTKKDLTEKEIRGKLDTKKSDAESSLAEA